MQKREGIQPCFLGSPTHGPASILTVLSYILKFTPFVAMVAIAVKVVYKYCSKVFGSHRALVVVVLPQ
jgi:hypothetical protein